MYSLDHWKKICLRFWKIAATLCRVIALSLQKVFMSEVNNPKPSIIAEPAVATYGRTKPSYATFFFKAPQTIADVEAPDAVWEFARKHDLVPYIEMVIQWVREFFPTACNFSLEYVIDPEVENYSWIEVRFYVSGAVDDVFQQYQQLNEKRRQHIPFDKSDLIGVIFGWRE